MCSGGTPVDARGGSTAASASSSHVLGMTGEKLFSDFCAWPALITEKTLNTENTRNTATPTLRGCILNLLLVFCRENGEEYSPARLSQQSNGRVSLTPG